MNLFLLHHDPTISATMHTDKHVVKMTLETAQILCSAHWICDGCVGDGWYRLTHARHPVVRWAAANVNNYKYTYVMFSALAAEYEYRFGRVHESWRKLGDALVGPPHYISDEFENIVALAMPEQYWPGTSRYVTIQEGVAAYRRYYRAEKRPLFRWKKRPVPDWLVN